VLEFILDHLGEVKAFSAENAKCCKSLDDRVTALEAAPGAAVDLSEIEEKLKNLCTGHDNLCKGVGETN